MKIFILSEPTLTETKETLHTEGKWHHVQIRIHVRNENSRNSNHTSKYIKYILLLRSLEKITKDEIRENGKGLWNPSPLHKRNKTNKNCQNQLFDDSTS